MVTDEVVSAPVRAFISYSWSSPTHESWVLNLASRLREDGVDILLDKWDLKPGHDAYAFMESMVTDASVTKVVMICDKTYAVKANSRSGGVGAESQIISPEIYGNSKQDKFAAVMVDDDEDGQANTPAFFKGRIYFDFRSAEQFEEGYEQLLRWLLDRPLHVKPKLGKVPDFILESRPAVTTTQSRARRAEDAIRQGSASAAALVLEYGDALITELRLLSPTRTEDEHFDDAIIRSISDMRPYLRQFSELVATTIRFSGEHGNVWDRIIGILEKLGTLMHKDPETSQWTSQQFDSYIVFGHEAFLIVFALSLQEERFDLAEATLRRPYLVRDYNGGAGRVTSDYTAFREYPQSLEHRNQRLNLNRVSLQADLVHEAHPRGSLPEFELLMQADFVLFLRGASEATYNNWYPLTLAYASRRSFPFPIFARAESRAYFDKLAPILLASSPDALRERVTEMKKNGMTSRLFSHWGLPVEYLSNAQNLGVLP